MNRRSLLKRKAPGESAEEQVLAANLDYIVITDHNTIQAKQNEGEGWHDRLLVLVGEEIGEYGRRHYLAFGIEGLVSPVEAEDAIAQYIAAVKRQGGIGFAAHPYELQNKSLNLYLPAWLDWDNPGYTGLEIWSYMYDWARNITPINIFYYYFRPGQAISGPPRELLQKWDQLGQKRRIVGIGGADVHAKHLFPLNFIQFLSYKRAFRGIRTHLITKEQLSHNTGKAKQVLYDALEHGHCFFAHDALADSRGFAFRGEMGNRTLVMGDEAILESSVQIMVESPIRADLQFLRNGKVIKEVKMEKQLNCRVEKPGVYRIEGRFKDKTWLFTNPIYLRAQ